MKIRFFNFFILHILYVTLYSVHLYADVTAQSDEQSIDDKAYKLFLV